MKPFMDPADENPKFNLFNSSIERYPLATIPSRENLNGSSAQSSTKSNPFQMSSKETGGLSAFQRRFEN